MYYVCSCIYMSIYMFVYIDICIDFARAGESVGARVVTWLWGLHRLFCPALPESSIAFSKRAGEGVKGVCGVGGGQLHMRNGDTTRPGCTPPPSIPLNGPQHHLRGVLVKQPPFKIEIQPPTCVDNVY